MIVALTNDWLIDKILRLVALEKFIIANRFAYFAELFSHGNI